MIVKLPQIQDRVTPDIMRSWALEIEKAFLRLSPIISTPNTPFTPTLFGETTPGTPTYTNATGLYSKLGNVVTFGLYVAISAKGGLAGGVDIGGLPFKSTALTAAYHSYALQFSGVTFPAGYTTVVGEHDQNTGVIRLVRCGSAVAATLLLDTDIAAASYFIVSGSYQTAS